MKLKITIHTLIFSNCFILVLAAVGLEPIPVTLGDVG